MKTKRKLPAATKKEWRPIRDRYTWHLRPPFDKLFDRTHWWEGQPEPEPQAALYELARRHPAVGLLQARLVSDPSAGLLDEPDALHCLATVGLKPWLQLDDSHRELWLEAAGCLKGLDCRGPVARCYALTSGALTDPLLRLVSQVAKSGKTKKTLDELAGAVGGNLKEEPIPREDFEADLARAAVDASRRGFAVLAVALDLSYDDAAALLAEAYRKERRRFGITKPRARYLDWLPLVQKFELEQSAIAMGPNSQDFIRYRRAIDGLDFGPQSIPFVSAPPA